MLLTKLKRLQKAYDSLYDFNAMNGYKHDAFLKELETEAKQYGYKFVLNARDVWKLKQMTDAEFKAFKQEVGE